MIRKLILFPVFVLNSSGMEVKIQQDSIPDSPQIQNLNQPKNVELRCMLINRARSKYMSTHIKLCEFEYNSDDKGYSTSKHEHISNKASYTNCPSLCKIIKKDYTKHPIICFTNQDCHEFLTILNKKKETYKDSPQDLANLTIFMNISLTTSPDSGGSMGLKYCTYNSDEGDTFLHEFMQGKCLILHNDFGRYYSHKLITFNELLTTLKYILVPAKPSYFSFLPKEIQKVIAWQLFNFKTA